MWLDIDPGKWERIRRYHLYKLAYAYRHGYVDKGIIPLIEAINNYSSDCVTTSSCYGRIVLLKLIKIGMKDKSIFYKKWHEPIKKEILMEAIYSYKDDTPLWLVLQSTIIHIKCRTLKMSIWLRNLGLESGYKYSKLLSISTRGFTTEISGTERLNLPLKINNKILVKEEFLEYFSKISDEMFRRIEIKKNRFIEILKNKNLKIKK